MTDAELRDAAVTELKLTTAGWRKPNGNPNYPSGTAPASTHWGKAMRLLGEIGQIAPTPSPLYLADFETGDFSQVVSQQESSSGRIALTASDPLQGRYSALVKNGPADIGVAGAGSSLRTEIAFAFFADAFGGSLEGKESWVTWEQKLDAAFQIASWCIITQFHGGTGSPVFAIEADPPAPDGVLYTVIRGGDVNANYRAIPIAKPVPRGMLMRFKVFHHWSTGPSGRVKVWLNDALVVDDQGPNLYKGHESGPHHKAGVYRSASGVTTDSQLLLDNVAWYTSDPSVGA